MSHETLIAGIVLLLSIFGVGAAVILWLETGRREGKILRGDTRTARLVTVTALIIKCLFAVIVVAAVCAKLLPIVSGWMLEQQSKWTWTQIAIGVAVLFAISLLSKITWSAREAAAYARVTVQKLETIEQALLRIEQTDRHTDGSDGAKLPAVPRGLNDKR